MPSRILQMPKVATLATPSRMSSPFSLDFLDATTVLHSGAAWLYSLTRVIVGLAALAWKPQVLPVRSDGSNFEAVEGGH